MNLDIRTPIGYFFAIVGIVLVVFGLVSKAEIYERHSLGINVNLWWGLALLVFAATMLAMAWRARRSGPGENPPPA